MTANQESNPLPPDPEFPGWRSRLQWFAAEFTVVVAGILVALALQAWWQYRLDASRGEEYQRQILSDVRITERTLRRSMALDRSHSAATARLSAALHGPEAITQASAWQWLQSYSGWFADPRPILGNVNALIQTGDIRLVQSPQVRAAIISYASIMEGAWRDRETQSARMYRGNDLSLARLEAAGVPPIYATLSETGTYERKQLAGYLPVYVAAWPRLRGDEQFRIAQQWRLLAYSNIEAYNNEMLAATSRLRQVLEAPRR